MSRDREHSRMLKDYHSWLDSPEGEDAQDAHLEMRSDALYLSFAGGWKARYAVPPIPEGVGLSDQEKALIDCGEWINAMKSARNRTGLRLIQLKDLVDRYRYRDEKEK